MALRSYKFRFYPTRAQEKKLAQMFGASRWVWNQCLRWRSGIYQDLGESVNGVDFSRELTFLKKLPEYQWLNDVVSSPLTQSLRDQDVAFRKFFKEGAGYPRFKKRHHAQSLRVQLDQRTVCNNYRAGELLKLPGLGEATIRWSRRPVGIPKMVTVRRDAAHRYWVSMSIDEDVRSQEPIAKTVGIDFGLNHLATLSDGTRIDNPRHLAKYRARLKRLQQRLARQQRGSGRRNATKHRIARLHARISDCRREHLHRITTQIIRDNQVICVEDLNVKGMSASSKGDREAPGKKVKQKSGLNRSVLDASPGEFFRQLAYKADWYGRTLIKVDRFYPSSKTCGCCGHKLATLSLSLREWDCPACNAHHDRDENAAKNIEAQGLSQLIHPEDTGGVRDAGGEGGYPMAVSPRSTDQSSTCLEQA